MKESLNWSSLKLKTSALQKTMRRQATDCEKMFAEDISDKGLLIQYIERTLKTQQKENKQSN